jgi:predicted RNase H-like nuclease
MIACGVDGCKRGWYAVLVSDENGALEIAAAQVHTTFREVLGFADEAAVIAVDIPIGLSDGQPRECDVLARKMLGRPRASSVFPAPVRSALVASSYEEATRLTRQARGKGISLQSWAIFPKVREVDESLSADPQARVVEVHPELCFWGLGGRAMSHRKKTREGERERRLLLSGVLRGAFLTEDSAQRGVARDDVLDALVAAYTAFDLAAGRAWRIPETPTVDMRGLRMEMVVPRATDRQARGKGGEDGDR